MGKDTKNGTIKNGVKIAAMITTLGISLGVNLDQLHAQDFPKNQVKRAPAESYQHKVENRQLKVENNQLKFDNKQLKIENNQYKMDTNIQVPSSQLKN